MHNCALIAHKNPVNLPADRQRALRVANRATLQYRTRETRRPGPPGWPPLGRIRRNSQGISCKLCRKIAIIAADFVQTRFARCLMNRFFAFWFVVNQVLFSGYEVGLTPLRFASAACWGGRWGDPRPLLVGNACKKKPLARSRFSRGNGDRRLGQRDQFLLAEKVGLNRLHLVFFLPSG